MKQLILTNKKQLGNYTGVEKQKEERLDKLKEGNLDEPKEGKILYYLLIKII